MSRKDLAGRGAPIAVIACFTAICWGGSHCHAQKAPELGYVYPPAIMAGQTTVVQLGGYDLTPDLQFFVHDDRLRWGSDGVLSDFFLLDPPYWIGEKGMLPALPLPREITAKIEVPADLPAGIYRWQVANANGPSASAAFYVSSIDETLESRYRDMPQSLQSLPIGVSGRLSKIAEVDRYEFTATQSGAITAEVHARRIGADFHAVIEIRDHSGKLIADAADTEGKDLAITFDGQVGEKYSIALHDVDFRGHRSFVYRMSLTPGPRLLTTIPAAVSSESSSEMTFIGFGLQSGAAKLESLPVTVPIEPSVETTLRYSLKTAHGQLPPRKIAQAVVPTIVNPDVDVSGLETLPVPCGLTRVMNSSGEASYQFEATKGQAWSIAAWSRAIGSDLDLEIVILDESGKQLAAADDLLETQDTVLEFKVPGDGVYTCIVRDLSGRVPDASSVYHLELQLRPPSYSLTIPQVLSVPLGGQATLAIKAQRFGGFADEINIEASGLPKGVTIAEGATIPAKKNDLKLVFSAAADAEVIASRLRISGSATMDGKVIRQTATAIAAGNLSPVDISDQEVDFALLAVTMKPPFTVELTDMNRQRAVHCGTTYPAPFVISRSEGYEEVVTLQMASKQGRQRQGIRGPILEVPAATVQVSYPCFMPEWLATDRTSRMVVHGVGRVTDPSGNDRWIMSPANARVTMILEGALMKLAHTAPELTVKAGESFDVPIQVSRSIKLPTTVEVELVPPVEIAELVNAETITLQPGTDNRRLRIETRADNRLIGRWNLLLRASTLKDGKWPVLSQTEVEVEFSKRD